MSASAPTAEFASLVYGAAGVPLDDPAETFHEASSLYPGIAPHRLQTMLELARNPNLQQTVARASFTRDHVPGVDLPVAALGRVRLGEALAARSSSKPPERASLTASSLAAVLAAAYRSSDGRRFVPSGGGLYPLELYALTLAVEHVEPAVYHYNPYAHRLERLRPLATEAVAATLVDAELAHLSAALVVITAMFWRTRFKYGLRGYRFALIEAGHAMQNALLAAAALRLPALPLGGFYDRLLDELVGADSLNEASLYALVLGGRG
jgi:SagB-type dehydrogenase family enzyme